MRVALASQQFSVPNVGYGSKADIPGVEPMSAITPKATAKADMAEPGGRSNRTPSRPGRSDLDLFRDDQSVVDIDAQVSHRALYLGVSKQKLNGAQIAGAAVDHCCLCPPQ